MLLKKELTEYNRYQAFAIHMFISLVIFFIILVCITQYWYPGILFDTGNGWKAIGMIVGIDLILGPLLTLIVFNPQKNSLKFDLSIIALIQTAALIYGTWTIQQTRPVALAFISSYFTTIFANSELGKAVELHAQDLGTNQLYYAFDFEQPNAAINANQFEPYSVNSNKVLTTESPYINPDSNSDNLLIDVDPLMTSQRYISIDKQTGAIIQYIDKN